MDGLISSFQQHSNRFSAFSADSRERDDEKSTKGKGNAAATTTAAVSETSIFGNYTVASKEQGGQGGSHTPQNQITKSTSTEEVGFGSILGDTLASAAIVDKALQLVQSVKNTMLEELRKSLGVPGSDTGTTTTPQDALGQLHSLANGMEISFQADVVSGQTSNRVNVHITYQSISLSQLKQISLADILGTTSESFEKWFSQTLGFSFSASHTSIQLGMSHTSANGSTSIDFSMQHTQIQGSIHIKPDALTDVSLIDPLIIDLGGDGVELSSDTFEFDLDSDGRSDQISRPSGNSGFLALDKNNDGSINNGSELFGTKTGDGFKELAAYDANNDGRIDKNDPIYDKLRIWKPDGKGNGQLIGLGEVGIGAIYLDAKRNEMLFENASGEVLGVQRKTAAYERTDGTMGGIHHVDLAKRQTQQDTNVINKEKGIAMYQHSQGELDRLRFLNKQPTSGDSIAEHYQKIHDTFGSEHIGLLGSKKDDIQKMIQDIKNGNIPQEDLAVAQLDTLLQKKNSNFDGLMSILDSTIFGGKLGHINQSVFDYTSLLKAQRLLA